MVCGSCDTLESVLVLWGSELSVLHEHGVAHQFDLTTPNSSVLNLTRFFMSGAALQFAGAVGDLNGDGVDDFGVGAADAVVSTIGQTGQMFVIWGKEASSPTTPSVLPTGSPVSQSLSPWQEVSPAFTAIPVPVQPESSALTWILVTAVGGGIVVLLVAGVVWQKQNQIAVVL